MPQSRQARLSNPTRRSYFVVMIDYGAPYVGKQGPSGLEALVDPEVTRREVISRLVSGEYGQVSSIDHVEDGHVSDVTLELQLAASVIAEAA